MNEWDIGPLNGGLTEDEVKALFDAGILSPPELAPRTMPPFDLIAYDVPPVPWPIHEWIIDAQA